MNASSSAAAPKLAAESAQGPEAGRPSNRAGWSRGTALACVSLLVAVLASYSAIAHNGFVHYDDGLYVTDNPHLRAGLTWATVKWAFTTFDGGNWVPLTWLVHALDFHLFGLNAAGHHAVSVLLHALNAVLLFLALQWSTGFRWRSLVVAALFALHPVNVESVAWAAELKNVLSLTFLLLALCAYVWYARKPSVLRYGAVFLLFAFGLMSKSQVVTFPFLLLLWDYWPLARIARAAAADGAPNPSAGSIGRSWIGRSWVGTSRIGRSSIVAEKLPLLLLSAASVAVTGAAEKAGGAVASLSEISLPLRLETAVIGYARYLGKAFWPANLAALYPYRLTLYPLWQVAAAALILVIVTALALFRQVVFRQVVLRQIAPAQVSPQRDPKYLAVGWFWFLGSLVPMIGLVQVGRQAMADRFAYLPLIGIFLAMTWLVADSAAALHVPSRWVAMAAAACLLVLGVLTYVQVGYWRDTPVFWRHILAATRDNYFADVNLGEFLLNNGRAEEAAPYLREALALRPNNLNVSLDLAVDDESRGDPASAIARYQSAILPNANAAVRAWTYASMGFDDRALGQTEKARQNFEMALSLAPGQTRALIGLGLLAQDRGDWDEAIRDDSRAVESQPVDVTYLLLAQALKHEHRLAEADAALARVKDPAEAEKAAQVFLSRK